MTLRLFFHSDDLKANVEVLNCTPSRERICRGAARNLFHPQGGGQPCDTGWIGDSQVLRVVQDPDRIVHFVDQPINLGMTLIRVDEQRSPDQYAHAFSWPSDWTLRPGHGLDADQGASLAR